MFYKIYTKLSQNVKKSSFIKNTLLNYSINIFIYFFNFLSTPLLFKYLNKTDFGIYQIILMFLTWASLCNLGIGNGLRNKISEYVALNEIEKVKKTIGSAFYIAFILALVVILIAGIFFLFIFNPQWLFNDQLNNISDVRLAFFLTSLFFSVNFITGLFSSIYLGLQKSYVATFVQLLNIAVFCFLIFLITKLSIPSLVSNVAICYGTAMVLSNFFPFFLLRKNSQIWPPIYSRKNNNIETKSLMNTSFGFLFLQISTLLFFCSDSFIIARLLGAEQVTEYSIANKLFFFIIAVFSILLIQVWNAITHAKTQNNHIWITRAVKKLYACLIPIFLISIIIAYFFDKITFFWIGSTFSLSPLFLYLFALYTFSHCLNAIYANVLNGLSRVKIQMIAYSLAGCFNIVLSFCFVKVFALGILGIILSKTICIMFTCSLCYWDYKRYIIDKSK